MARKTLVNPFILVLLLVVPCIAAFNVTTLSFNDAYAPLFGFNNIVRSADDRSVRLILDRSYGDRHFFSYINFGSISFFQFISAHKCIKLAFFPFNENIFFILLIIIIVVGSGFISSDMYLHGFFSASIKLPSDYTAGIVVAFYVSIF